MAYNSRKLTAVLAASMMVAALAGCSHNSAPPAPAKPADSAAQPSASTITQHMAIKSQQMRQARALIQKH
jgi:hypothetical protein